MSEPPKPTPPADLLAVHRLHGHDDLALEAGGSPGQRIVGRARRVLRRLLAPFLDRQAEYNAASARLASQLWEQLETVTRREHEHHQETLGLARAVQSLQDTLAALAADQHRLERRIVEHGADLEDSRTRAAADLARRLEELGRQQETALTVLTRSIADELQRFRQRMEGDRAERSRGADSATPLVGLARYYADLEARFRGSSADVKQRQRVYLDAIRRAGPTQATPVLDLGCGRGEWLELLGEEGIPARGVDGNPLFAQSGRARGLAVVDGDLLEHLRGLGSESVAAVTGFHIIEHFPFEDVLELLRATVRVLRRGGVAIFETPNPANVQVGSHKFYINPSHHAPLPAELAQFSAENCGLAQVQLLFLHPDPGALAEDGQEVTRRFNQFFYGAQDYAVVGWKS